MLPLCGCTGLWTPAGGDGFDTWRQPDGWPRSRPETVSLPLLRHRPSSSSAAATVARLGISRFLFQPSAQRLVRKHQRLDPPDGKQSTVHIHKQDVDPPRRHCYRTDFPEQAGAIQGYQGSKYSRRTSHWAGNLNDTCRARKQLCADRGL